MYLNHDYMLTVGTGAGASTGLCRLIQSSPRGFNFLHLSTGKVVFSTALRAYMGQIPTLSNPKFGIVFAEEIIKIEDAETLHNDLVDGFANELSYDEPHDKVFNGFAKIIWLEKSKTTPNIESHE